MDKQRERKKLAELLCRVTCEGGEDFGNCPERRNGHCRSIHRLEMCQVGAIANHILEDEEIKHAFELLKAEKEGRLIEAHCKVGHTVYAFCDVFGAILPYYVEAMHFYGKQFEYLFEANCNKDGELLDGIDFNGEDIGKTVFLSREAAEKALEERKNN